MNSILNPLLSWLLLYKYAALFGVEYVSAIVVPFPITATLLAVGAFASYGYFNFWLSLAVAVGANTLGDLTDYGLTRKYGETISRALRLHRLPFFGHLKEELTTDAAITVFITRFAGSLSPVANILAGLVGVPLSKFFVFDMLGNFVEPTSALTIGYLAGDYWSNFSLVFDIAGGIAAVGIVFFILFRIQRRIERKYAKSGDP